jgi:hypothetical protein
MFQFGQPKPEKNAFQNKKDKQVTANAPADHIVTL